MTPDLHSLQLEAKCHPSRAIVRDLGSLKLTVTYALPPRVRDEELVVPEFAFFYVAQEKRHPEDPDTWLSDAISLSEDEAGLLLAGRSLDDLIQRRDGIADQLWQRIEVNNR